MHVVWLRSYIPELGTSAVYIRRCDELAEDMRVPRAIAWFSVTGDLESKPLLIERDEWAGRGHFIGVNERWHTMVREEQRAILLHEISHSLCAFDSWGRVRDEDSFTEFEQLLMTPTGADELRAQYGLPAADPVELERGSHDARWIRCCVHLAARAWMEVSIFDMCVFSQRYALDEEYSTEAIRALMPEVRRGGHLEDILRSPMPSEFAKLFE